MQNQKLTLDEISTLLSALKTWVNAPATDEMGGALIGIMFASLGAKDELEAKTRVKEATDRSRRSREKVTRDCEMRNEASILLQAKLITMRNEINEEMLKD